jgi:hypothetical protein
MIKPNLFKIKIHEMKCEIKVQRNSSKMVTVEVGSKQLSLFTQHLCSTYRPTKADRAFFSTWRQYLTSVEYLELGFDNVAVKPVYFSQKLSLSEK